METEFQYKYICNNCKQRFVSDSYKIIIDEILNHHCKSETIDIAILCFYCNDGLGIKSNNPKKDHLIILDTLEGFIKGHLCKEMKDIKEMREEEEEEKELSKQLKDEYDIFIR